MFAGGSKDLREREKNKTTTDTMLVLIPKLWFGFEVIAAVIKNIYLH